VSLQAGWSRRIRQWFDLDPLANHRSRAGNQYEQPHRQDVLHADSLRRIPRARGRLCGRQERSEIAAAPPVANEVTRTLTVMLSGAAALNQTVNTNEPDDAGYTTFSFDFVTTGDSSTSFSFPTTSRRRRISCWITSRSPPRPFQSPLPHSLWLPCCQRSCFKASMRLSRKM